MADDKAKAEESKPTRYRVLQRTGEGEIVVGITADKITVEMFALLPGEYEGHAVKQAAEQYGEGVYVAVALSSFKPKTAVIPAPKLRII